MDLSGLIRMDIIRVDKSMPALLYVVSPVEDSITEQGQHKKDSDVVVLVLL